MGNNDSLITDVMQLRKLFRKRDCEGCTFSQVAVLSTHMLNISFQVNIEPS